MSAIQSIYQSHYEILVRRRGQVVEELAEINAQITLLRQEAEAAGVKLER